MNENFAKFKKKIWTEIFVKCGIIALLFAFVALDAVLLPCKLCGINLLWIFYVLIGLGGFALGGGIAFLILRTNDEKIAKRLDSELNLFERVQTALEYGNSSSDILLLQREDTFQALSAVPVKSLRFKHLLVTVLCGAIALLMVVAMPVMAVTVPPVFAQETQTPPEPPREVTDWEWAALDELIKYVQSSKKADEESKSAMVADLNGLKNLLLRGTFSQSNLTQFVENTATQVSNDVRVANEKYPAQSDGSAHPQAQANSEEAAYVINQLREIFKLPTPSDNDPSGNENPENPPETENPENPPSASGGMNASSAPFFDPEKGQVTYGEVSREYYEKMQAAFEEGLISKEEWEEIMVAYFNNLEKEDD